MYDGSIAYLSRFCRIVGSLLMAFLLFVSNVLRQVSEMKEFSHAVNDGTSSGGFTTRLKDLERDVLLLLLFH